MAIDEVDGQAWTRKHDDPAWPVVPRAPRTLYPKSLEELIQICSERQPSERIHAAGSHWALSAAAISDAVFIETHDPDNVHQAMGRTLYDVVSGPGCLNAQFVDGLVNSPAFDAGNAEENQGLYPVHIETGKRVYQLYSELDVGDDHNQSSLAVHLATQRNKPDYLGSWGFQTLGGAGGQTVFGALTTGTHGGDFRMPPMSDAVMALHLVADGGKHYWIEPASPTRLGVALTDDAALKALYDQPRYQSRYGAGNFEVLRDDDIFNSVLVSAGRFGIVYSIVIAAVRQYSLHEERRLTTWQEIKSQISNPDSDLYKHQDQPPALPSLNRFLQVGISVTPHANSSKNHAGVTKRWNVPLAAIPETGEPAGRLERRGNITNPFDEAIQAPRFSLAGNSHSYTPNSDEPGKVQSGSFLARACSNADFVDGILESVITEIEDFIDSNGAAAGPAIKENTEEGTGLHALIPALRVIVALLSGLSLALRLLPALGKPRFGHVMKYIKDILLMDPMLRGAGIFVWRMISTQAFKSQQAPHDFEAISYAVMDGHDYFDRSCTVNVDSIEVFFKATDKMLIPYIDALLAFEAGQEVAVGRAFVGYISLRFTGPSRALLGPTRTLTGQQEAPAPIWCAIEIAGLRDATGVSELMDFAMMLALDNNFKGILHWGQRNDSQRAHIEERFGDTHEDQTGNLHVWRNALSRITENGKLNGFSSEFTRRNGLEVVTPTIESLSATGAADLASIMIDWKCDQNPPGIKVVLKLDAPSGKSTPFSDLPLAGQKQVPIDEFGVFRVSLTASIDLDDEGREASKQVDVSIDAPLN